MAIDACSFYICIYSIYIFCCLQHEVKMNVLGEKEKGILMFNVYYCCSAVIIVCDTWIQ